jgi:two-component system LytT family response regulator
MKTSALRIARSSQQPVRLVALPVTSDRISVLQNIRNTGKLILPTSKGFECVRLDEILFLRAQSNYTEIHTISRKLLFSKTLKSIEELLPHKSFCRVHKSYVVNASFIRSYFNCAQDPHLVLDNETCIPVSRSHRKELTLTSEPARMIK